VRECGRKGWEGEEKEIVTVTVEREMKRNEEDTAGDMKNEVQLN
jgi:hypothetical protein